jgi:serine/threonine-protein kinase
MVPRALAAIAIAGCSSNGGRYFASPMFFDHDVSSAPRAADSATIIASLDDAGGWGNGDRLTIDFSMDVLVADASTPRRAFAPTSDWVSPDCDRAPVPLPDGGNVEGETGYACTGGGDCHLLVVDKDAGELFEMWRADATATAFIGGCLAVWHLKDRYGDALRGDQCTSADAAGLPIAPLLFDADEVAAGSIDHALRFVLPNDRVRRGFVRPATHATDTTGAPTAPYYGVHLRLRADYPIDTLPSEGAKVVARALQRYGMFHADGGEIAITARDDRRTSAKWAGLLGEHDLEALRVDDFEVIDHGAAIALTYDCTR